MENDSSAVRIQRKLNDFAHESIKEKHIHARSKSANSRVTGSDTNASLRYRRMKRKVDALRTQIDAALNGSYLTTNETNCTKDILSSRDDDIPLKKKNDEQNLVTSELIQVLNSKQTRIDELEQQLKDIEQHESQWKAKYERECHRRELLQQKLIELEKELRNRQRQSKLLAQLQNDVEQLHLAFNTLEAENLKLNAQLSLMPKTTRILSPIDKFRQDLTKICHESFC